MVDVFFEEFAYLKVDPVFANKVHHSCNLIPLFNSLQVFSGRGLCEV